jgi:iduronate 2-sulfatase
MNSVKLVLICATCLTGASSASADGPTNVLFIASDDMRPQLGCYGDLTVKSPNIDALAKRGMVFHRSYVQQALCSPSRISMLSGRYPATTGIFEIGRTLRTTMPDITTLPQHFKNHGYHTRSLGKIYHVGIDDGASWTVSAWHSNDRPTRVPLLSLAVYYIRKSRIIFIGILEKNGLSMECLEFAPRS